MTRKVSRQRLREAREIGSMLVQDPKFAASLPMQDTGERAVIVAGPTERMRSFFERTSAVGFPVTVSVKWRRRMNLFHVRQVNGADHRHDDDVLHVHRNITMAMLVDALWEQAGSITLHLIEPQEELASDYEVVAAR